MKHTDFCGKHIFNYLFSQVFIYVLILRIFRSHPPHNPEHESLAKEMMKITQFSAILRFIIHITKFHVSICYRSRTTAILKCYQIPQNHLPYPHLKDLQKLKLLTNFNVACIREQTNKIRLDAG